MSKSINNITELNGCIRDKQVCKHAIFSVNIKPFIPTCRIGNVCCVPYCKYFTNRKIHLDYNKQYPFFCLECGIRGCDDSQYCKNCGSTAYIKNYNENGERFNK